MLRLVDTTLNEVVIVARNYKLDSIERTIIYGRGLREQGKRYMYDQAKKASFFIIYPASLLNGLQAG
jgi:hypothetical protein